MQAVRLIGEFDFNFAWWRDTVVDPATWRGDHVPSRARGAFACVNALSDDRHRLMRDPLGVNKLFWAENDGGVLLVATRPYRLVQEGVPFQEIRAFPAATVVDLDLKHGATAVTTPPFPLLEREATLDVLPSAIRSTLDRFLAALAASHPARRIFVCLSGGLDSTGITVLAREHFRDVTAVSFDLDRGSGPPSEDRVTARRLAKDLGLPLYEVTPTVDEVLELVDTVLIEAIDWRDFNVHAALVNACLARGIAASLRGNRSEAKVGVGEGSGVRGGEEGCGVGANGSADAPLVLTGEMANEFLVDYQPESYRARTYYALPRLPLPALRDVLVRGLQTTHREVGPFQAWGLPLVQPYSVVAEDYLALPAEFLARPDRKEQLARRIFGSLVPDYVYQRPKTRAQVGDSDVGRGVLAVCADHGLDAQWLEHRFAELHGLPQPASLNAFMRGGRYRTGVPTC